MVKARTFVVCAGLLALLLPRPAAAAWPTDPNVNVPLCTADSTQGSVTSVSDGSGGAIVTWQDYRDGNWDIYAQRISGIGTRLWPANGVVLCAAIGNQQYPNIVSDGAGGAIVSWGDFRSGYWVPYGQRISATGTVMWTTNGEPLSTAFDCQIQYQYNPQDPPQIVSDGAGGAIVTWRAFRQGVMGAYAQRISATGTVQWNAAGVAICGAKSGGRHPVVSDGAGGAIVAWVYQDYIEYMWNIYAQRTSAEGVLQWPADSVDFAYSGDPIALTAVSDGASGAIVAWSNGWGIYAQRISADGAPQWDWGVGVGGGDNLSDSPTNPTIASDGAGGAIVAWGTFAGSSPNLYAQRISAEGALQWTAGGVAITPGPIGYPYDSPNPTIASDGTGAAIVAWEDWRNGDRDIYAQRISAEGTPQWTADGVALCTATGDQQSPTIVSDGAGGTIVTWQDCRSGNCDIYAQNVNADGTLGPLVPTPVLVSLVSADVGVDRISLTWLAGGSESGAAIVYRSSGAGEWMRLAEIAADGTGYLRYTDPIDATATRVGYRLGIVEAGIEGFYGETWVDLPPRNAALTFALDPVRPNPSRGGALTVHFSLPTDAPARLDLLDVAGRRIASHEAGAGQHTLDLGAGQRLAPGLYLVRLTQGANTRTTRVAVIS